MTKNQGKNWQNEKPQESQKIEELKRELEQELEKEIPDIWRVIDLQKQLGLRDKGYETITPKEFNLSSGKHYFVLESIGKRSIKCISCPITHGGILEAHLLTRYKLEDGVISLDGKPLNEAPAMPNVDKGIAGGNNGSKV